MKMEQYVLIIKIIIIRINMNRNIWFCNDLVDIIINTNLVKNYGLKTLNFMNIKFIFLISM